MTLLQIIENNQPIRLQTLARSHSEAVRDIQNKLTALGLLDPRITGSVPTPFAPAPVQDGIFGNETLAMLEYFATLTGNIVGGKLSIPLAILLTEANPAAFFPINTTENPNDTTHTKFAKKLVRYLQSKGYWIARSPDMYNVVYAEGLSHDGLQRPDIDNEWNDLRTMLRISADGTPELILSVEATTEPSRVFVSNRRNKIHPDGISRIAFGQYKAWQMGFHKQRLNHPALVQRDDVRVHRDKNRDGTRSNDKIFIQGVKGINQHSTITSAGSTKIPKLVNGWSEGCLVGRVWDEHREFLHLLQTDIRYVKNNNYKFMTAVLAGDDFTAARV